MHMQGQIIAFSLITDLAIDGGGRQGETSL
jgi:hypothetical protein